MKRNFTLTLALTAASLAFFSSAASAYQWQKCWTGADMKWSSNNIYLRPHYLSFANGNSWNRALKDSIKMWNDAPSKVHYAIVAYDRSVGYFNGQNEVWFSGSLDDGVLGITMRYGNAFCHYVEADIVFASSTFTTSTSKSRLKSYSASSTAKPSFQGVALHEMGHAQGLDHEGDVYGNMGSITHLNANGSTARTYVGEDSADGSVDVYGKNSASTEDLGVVHWRFWKQLVVDGQLPYAVAARTRVFNSRNRQLPWSFAAGTREPVYRVNRGQRVKVEFSFENNGKTSPLETTARFYLSTDDTITTRDPYLGQRTLNLGRNSVYTSRTTLTLPSNLRRGRNYWIGVIIDPTNSVTEVNESNNRSYVGIRIN